MDRITEIKKAAEKDNSYRGFGDYRIRCSLCGERHTRKGGKTVKGKFVCRECVGKGLS
ncbi:MAG: hypothetical protein KJO91_09940 [Gammaproteobacteria bacterium]|nr:hypothetical protein [Gammaproteobacteria bacterium]